MKINLSTGWLKFLLLIPVIIALWLPRGLELDRFLTADEPRWLTRSANFFLALSEGDFSKTYQKEHPGVTIMWAGSAGFRWIFPWYVSEDPGQHARPQDLNRFLENRNYDYMPMRLLEAGRSLVVLGNVIVLALTFLAAVRLIGLIPSLIGFLLIAFDPFSIALSRLLHLDGLLSAFMLFSLLSFMNYLYQGRRLYDLALAAFSAGLAWLTKSPSFFLIPFFGLLSLIEIGRWWRAKHQLSLRVVWMHIWPFLAWAGMAALVFTLFWPAMWVDPIGSLQEMLSEATNYASEGHHAPTFFNGQIFEAGISDWRFYPVIYLWRTTPPVLIGLIFTGLAFVFRRRLSFPKEQQRAVFILFLFAVLYTIFMTLGAKKFDRYLIPIFAPLALVAGVGWGIVIQNAYEWVTAHWKMVSNTRNIALLGATTILTLVILIQLAGALQTYPYYFTYYNPLMGGKKRAPEVMMIGWGEGLDQAARYLNTKPDSNMLRVQSWYPVGPFSFIFEGKTINKDFVANPERLERADYYVLYFHQWQRQRPSEEFIRYFDQQVPEHIVYVDDLEYARIYRRDELTPPSQPE
jgi:hypothetical protein